MPKSDIEAAINRDPDLALLADLANLDKHVTLDNTPRSGDVLAIGPCSGTTPRLWGRRMDAGDEDHAPGEGAGRLGRCAGSCRGVAAPPRRLGNPLGDRCRGRPGRNAVSVPRRSPQPPGLGLRVRSTPQRGSHEWPGRVRSSSRLCRSESRPSVSTRSRMSAGNSNASAAVGSSFPFTRPRARSSMCE